MKERYHGHTTRVTETARLAVLRTAGANDATARAIAWGRRSSRVHKLKRASPIAECFPLYIPLLFFSHNFKFPSRSTIPRASQLRIGSRCRGRQWQWQRLESGIHSGRPRARRQGASGCSSASAPTRRSRGQSGSAPCRPQRRQKGKILDQYRIDVTLATMYNIIERGGRLIIMSHVGRPYDKKTKTLTVKQDEAVDAVVGYLQRKLRIKFAIPKFHVFPNEGIEDVDTSVNWLIQDLRSRKVGGIYLPNTRWFAGEEDKGEKMERLAVQLAGLADVYVNDAFGSWQPHTSTFHVTKYLPSFAGLCMQDELSNVRAVLEPKRPFVAIVAGAKYDTKIGPLTAIYKRVDYLILGGLIYNTFLCAKYGVKIKGVEESDIALAKELVEQDRNEGKVLELPVLVESDTLEGRTEGNFRTVHIKDFKAGQEYQYIVDVDPASFESAQVREGLENAKTIFVNAVMGLMPSFWHGTSRMDETIDRNRTAQKFFGGGDTLQEFKSLHPGLYHAALDSPKYYMFTGGGTVLKVLEEADPLGLPTVKALIANGEAFGYPKWRASYTAL